MARLTVSSTELVSAGLAAITRHDHQGERLAALGAIAPDAMAIAERLDVERTQGRLRGALHGLPLLIKDNLETIDLATTAGSKVLEGWHPTRDAELVRRLRAAGAIVLAKANMHEFAFGNRGVGSGFGRVRNPHDPARSAGGSSSGVGAGIAAGYAFGGVGTDTCGSIGIPSAFNGIAGLRPTQGLTSRRGIIPLSSTQDIGGPMARSVADLALLLDVLAGSDPVDPQTLEADRRRPAFYAAAARPEGVRGLRIGRLGARLRVDDEDAPVAAVVDAAFQTLAAAGAEIVDVAVPDLVALLHDDLFGSLVLVHDFRFDLDLYLAENRDIPLRSFADLLDSPLVHPLLRSNLALAAAVPSRDTSVYRAQIVRRAQLAAALTGVIADHELAAIAYPTVRRKAPLGESPLQGINSQLGANSGLPVLTLPCGRLDGLPVGLDLLAPAWGEPGLLAAGMAIEGVLGRVTPPLEVRLQTEG